MNGMLKAGLIGLGLGAVLGLGITLVSPLCTPCAALLVGVGVGFLACLWDRPADVGSCAALGAKAGAIAGVGGLLGQMLGMTANALLVGPERAMDVATQWFDLPAVQLDASAYWVSQIALNCMCGLTNVALVAGLGALGGLLWYQAVGKNAVA